MSPHPPAFVTWCKVCGDQMLSTTTYERYPVCHACKANPRKACSCLASGREEDVANCTICRGGGTVPCES